MKILNYGSLSLDFTYLVDHFVTAGETITTSGLSVNYGGKGLNQSLAVRRAGMPVFHAGKVGSDGLCLKSFLKENGVNTEFLGEGDFMNGQAIIQLAPDGQNCIFLYPGSNHENTEDEVGKCLSVFGPGDILMLQNEINLIPYIIDMAFEKGMEIVLNPSPITPELINEYPLGKVSMFILNEVEGRDLTGFDEPGKILGALNKKYPAAKVLLTLGSLGAIYSDGEKIIKHGVYSSDVVDTTAAGDTMAGYFIGCLGLGFSVEKALKYASIAASIAISRKGASPSIPTMTEVEKSRLKYIDTGI